MGTRHGAGDRRRSAFRVATIFIKFGVVSPMVRRRRILLAFGPVAMTAATTPVQPLVRDDQEALPLLKIGAGVQKTEATCCQSRLRA